MGGHALKNTTTRRYAKQEYEDIKQHIIQALSSHPNFVGRRVEAIEAYRAKDSFGDLDLLVESDGLPHTVWFAIQELFSPQDFVRNGTVTSFDVKEFQVDLLMTPSSIYDMSAAYFAYNDLGNLLGRVAYKMGLRYGHQGLGFHVYSEQSNNTLLDSVTLTADPMEAMAFLGYDVDRWKKGFTTIEDIFEFTTSSPHFHADFYDLDKRTYKARVRDAKRPTYTKFLEWLSLHDYSMATADEGFQALHLARAKEVFPHFSADVEKVYKIEKNAIESKTKLNAHMLAEWLGRPLEQVGPWFKQFKLLWPTEQSFHAWVLATSVPDIEQKVALEKNLSIPGPSMWSLKNVQSWTGLRGPALNELFTRFPQQWMNAGEFQTWVKTEDEESLKAELLKHKDFFFSRLTKSCTLAI